MLFRRRVKIRIEYIVFTRTSRQIMIFSHRHLANTGHLVGSIFSHGVIDLFRDPKAVADYWRRIASAAVHLPEGDSKEWLGLPRCNIDQIITDAESIPVTLIEYQYAYGDMPLHEVVMLCRIVRHRQPRIVFEIGTYLGGTTLQLVVNSQAKVYTLDHPPPGHKDYVQPPIWDPESDVHPDQPGIRFLGSQYEIRIHQLFGDSQTYDFMPYHGSVDLVFVDGCHHYEFVHRDSLNAIRMISPNGVIVWHDYASYAPGVVRALNELNNEYSLRHITGTSLVIYIS